MKESAASRLRRYLLGGLSAEEEESIERDYFVNGDRFAELQAAEDDLIDHYVADFLSAEDRARFAERFVSPEQLERVEFARSLRRRLRQEALKRPNQERPRWAWALGGVAAALVAALPLAGILFFRARAVQREADHARAERIGLKQQVAEQRRRIEELVRERTVSASALGEVVTAVLRPGLERGEGAGGDLVRGRDARWLRLRLAISGRRFQRYAVSVQTPDAAEVVSQSGLLAVGDGPEAFVETLLPAESLARGTYVILLSGIDSRGKPMELETYHLRVRP